MANETFANKKKKKALKQFRKQNILEKKKNLRLTQTFSLWFLDSGTEKEKKKNAVTYKCVFSKLVFTSKKEKSKQLHDHHRMAFEVINDFFLKQKEDHFAFWISI